MPTFAHASFLSAIGAAALLTLAGCASTTSSENAFDVTVDSTADDCTVSVAEAPAGTVKFTVMNSGDEETEFYLLAANGETVKGEAEHIGPGLTAELVIDLEPGSYVTACKPGSGERIGEAEFTVVEGDSPAK